MRPFILASWFKCVSIQRCARELSSNRRLPGTSGDLAIGARKPALLGCQKATCFCGSIGPATERSRRGDPSHNRDGRILGIPIPTIEMGLTSDRGAVGLSRHRSRRSPMRSKFFMSGWRRLPRLSGRFDLYMEAPPAGRAIENAAFSVHFAPPDVSQASFEAWRSRREDSRGTFV